VSNFVHDEVSAGSGIDNFSKVNWERSSNVHEAGIYSNRVRGSSIVAINAGLSELAATFAVTAPTCFLAMIKRIP
jgi:hypothetical protein